LRNDLEHLVHERADTLEEYVAALESGDTLRLLDSVRRQRELERSMDRAEADYVSLSRTPPSSGCSR